ncbi:hypothetical protein M2322_004631 [Rhodoblastus acidophilus]|uniref:hypothetical protein n=1 Tax=Rhodoblastus acidophilus TaxID=1074 RepID=UPI0022242C0E|nr:hypothetical protein [Rhodoblastus acidophilus]MCW2319062.1 hypothetical protein [Rhodoblastus acidophilus]
MLRPKPLRPDEWLDPASRALRAALYDARRLPVAATHMANLQRCLRLMIESGALFDDDSDPLIASNKLRLHDIVAEAQRLVNHYEELWGLSEAHVPAPVEPEPAAPLPLALPQTVASVEPEPMESPPASSDQPQKREEMDNARLIALLARGPRGDGRTPYVLARQEPHSVYRALASEFALAPEACDALLRRLVAEGMIVIESRGLPPHGRVRPIIRVTPPARKR